MNLIGPNLKRLLLKENISENELSKRLGISQQIINRIISGLNQNPKLSTIMPIAEYFNIPLHELVSNPFDNNLPLKKFNNKVPYVEFKELKNLGVEKALSSAKRYISIDVDVNCNYFATSMYDNSMEPKFSKGSILVFATHTEAYSGDFCLLKDDSNHYMFRQIMINSLDKKFVKCLNPICEEYDVLPLPINFYILATLLESRNFFN